MSEQRNYVAVVDDDESFARAVSRLLRAVGFETSLYPSAEEFLLERSVPMCLVLDVHLGGMSGLELQRILATRSSAIPIIFVTAHDDEETRDQAQQAGCVAYLRKPVPKTFLLDAIEKAVKTHPTES